MPRGRVPRGFVPFERLKVSEVLMNLRSVAFATILILQSGVAAWSQTYTETTRVEKPVLINGEVVRLEPGKTIVVRSGGEEVSYVLGPGVVVPETVQVGRAVSLRTEVGPDGTTLVQQVTTTSVTPAGQIQRTTEVTRTKPSGATSKTSTTTTSAVTGEVVRFEPGKSIVIRSETGEVTYVLAPKTPVPAEIQVGRTATVQFVPGQDGTSTVKRISTTTLSPDGQVRETTNITRTDPAGRTSSSTVSTLTGKVEAYLPGKSITVIDPSGARVTYVLSGESLVTADMLMGKEVTIQVVPKEQDAVTYEIVRDGEIIRIKARKPQQD